MILKENKLLLILLKVLEDNLMKKNLFQDLHLLPEISIKNKVKDQEENLKASNKGEVKKVMFLKEESEVMKAMRREEEAIRETLKEEVVTKTPKEEDKKMKVAMLKEEEDLVTKIVKIITITSHQITK